MISKIAWVASPSRDMSGYRFFCEAFLDRFPNRRSSQAFGKKISLCVAILADLYHPRAANQNNQFPSAGRVGNHLDSSKFLLPLAVVLAVLCMLGSTASCSTVFFSGSGTGFLAPPSPLKVDGGQSAILAAEDLSRMARHKRTIARLPQALAPGRKLLRYLRS